MQMLKAARAEHLVDLDNILCRVVLEKLQLATKE